MITVISQITSLMHIDMAQLDISNVIDATDILSNVKVNSYNLCMSCSPS
mgnify:CR=1 FL=1